MRDEGKVMFRSCFLKAVYVNIQDCNIDEKPYVCNVWKTLFTQNQSFKIDLLEM